jgi:hypothetical protein
MMQAQILQTMQQTMVNAIKPAGTTTIAKG